MARLAGANIPDNKRVEVALTYVHGIGLTRSQQLLAAAGIDPNTRTKDLSEGELAQIRERIEKLGALEGDLRRQVFANIKRKKDIGSYQGLRHKKGITVRGQRTKTNTRTVRGNVRRTMGSGRKGAAKKT